MSNVKRDAFVEILEFFLYRIYTLACNFFCFLVLQACNFVFYFVKAIFLTFLSSVNERKIVL